VICQRCNGSITIVKNNSNREIIIYPSVFTFYSGTYFWSEHTYRQFIYKTHTHTHTSDKNVQDTHTHTLDKNVQDTHTHTHTHVS
jgi:hypothetical protein